MKKPEFIEAFGIIGTIAGILGAIPTIIAICQVIDQKISKDRLPYLIIILLLLILFLTSLVILINTRRQHKCPINSDSTSHECPLGIVENIAKASETLDEIFKTEREYYFLGLGSENICQKLGDDTFNLKKLNERSKNSTKPIEFHFIIRDKSNKELIKEQQKLRFDNDYDNYIDTQLKNSMNYHNNFRDKGFPFWTYLSDILASFRIVIVDDKIYVGFNEIGKSSQETHQLVIKKTDNPLNLYNWFYNYVIYNKKDIVRKSNIDKSKKIIYEPKRESEKPVHSEDCIFCKILKNDKNHTKEPYNEILFETDNFIVIPAKGHFVSGYLLVIPKTHVYSIFDFVSSNNISYEYQKLINEVRKSIENNFGKCIEFEHGSINGNGFAGNTIDHAHMHILPFDSSKLVYSIIDDFKKIERIENIDRLTNIRNPYLYINQDDKNYFSEITDELKGQYLRKHVYKSIFKTDDDGWDWRIHTHEDKLSKTINTIRDANK